MSTEVFQEVQRITSATDDIANAITEKGGTSPTGGIDTFSEAVQSIPSGESANPVYVIKSGSRDSSSGNPNTIIGSGNAISIADTVLLNASGEEITALGGSLNLSDYGEYEVFYNGSTWGLSFPESLSVKIPETKGNLPWTQPVLNSKGSWMQDILSFANPGYAYYLTHSTIYQVDMRSSTCLEMSFNPPILFESIDITNVSQGFDPGGQVYIIPSDGASYEYLMNYKTKSTAEAVWSITPTEPVMIKALKIQSSSGSLYTYGHMNITAYSIGTFPRWVDISDNTPVIKEWNSDTSEWVVNSNAYPPVGKVIYSETGLSIENYEFNNAVKYMSKGSINGIEKIVEEKDEVILPESTSEWLVKTDWIHPVLGQGYWYYAKINTAVNETVIKTFGSSIEVYKLEGLILQDAGTNVQSMLNIATGTVSNGVVYSMIKLRCKNGVLDILSTGGFNNPLIVVANMYLFSKTDLLTEQYVQLMSLGIQPEGDEANQIDQLQQIGVK